MVLDEKQQQQQQQQQQNGGIVGDDPYAAAMRSSKKNKNKKIPQRGLGVAQLEKLRLEEQQKNAAASSSSSDPSAQGLGLPPQPYIPLPSAESVLRPRVPYNILYRPPPIHPSSSVADLLGSAQQPAEASNDEQPGFLPMLCIDPKTCSTESLVKKYGYHVPLRGDLLNSNCRPMSAMPRKQQPPIALANAATLPLPLPSLRMEPPSNQNNSNSYDLLSYWKEERMVGNKRPWPFHVDGISSQTSYPHKFPSISSSCLKSEECSSAHGNNLVKHESQPFNSYLKSEECSAAQGNNLVRLEPQTLKGGTSNSFIDLTNSDVQFEKRKENGGATDGTFLSLRSLSLPSVKSNDNPQCHQHGRSDLNLMQSQKSSGDSSSSQGQPFYFFLPIGPTSSETTSNETRVEAEDDIDLNLKL